MKAETTQWNGMINLEHKEDSMTLNNFYQYHINSLLHTYESIRKCDYCIILLTFI